MLGFLVFPLWLMFFIFLLGFFFLVIWIFAIIDCLTSKRNTSEKLLWLFIVFLLNIIGAVIYFVFSKTIRLQKANFKGKKLLRSRKNRIIAGVCGGIGNYLGVDPTAIRLLWALLSIASMGAGILAYIIAWAIMPEEK